MPNPWSALDRKSLVQRRMALEIIKTYRVCTFSELLAKQTNKMLASWITNGLTEHDIDTISVATYIDLSNKLTSRNRTVSKY